MGDGAGGQAWRGVGGVGWRAGHSVTPPHRLFILRPAPEPPQLHGVRGIGARWGRPAAPRGGQAIRAGRGTLSTLPPLVHLRGEGHQLVKATVDLVLPLLKWRVAALTPCGSGGRCSNGGDTGRLVWGGETHSSQPHPALPTPQGGQGRAGQGGAGVWRYITEHSQWSQVNQSRNTFIH